LKRLGLSHRARAVLDLDAFLRAPGQGAIAITARSDYVRARQTLAPISDAAERAFLAELRLVPHAHRRSRPARGGRLRLKEEVPRTDGSERFTIAAEGAPADVARSDARPGASSRPAFPRAC
jgi:hydroxymethylbilane synthase